MSQHDLRMFFEAVVKDESLRARFEAMGAKYSDQDEDESQREAVFKNEVLPLAKSAGFDFTLEDVKAFQAGKSLKADKLADELDAVVGGGIIDPYQCYCIAGGGGRADDPGEGSCVCVIFGVGSDENGNKRCECAFGGMGLD